MAIELRQQLKLTQQLVMTPQLQQAIKLLQLNRLELSNLVQEELVENPVLEEALEGDEAPGSAEGEPEGAPADGSADAAADSEAPADLAPGEASPAEGVETGTEPEPSDAEKIADVEWDDYMDSHPQTGLEVRSGDDERPAFEATLTKRASLTETLTLQLQLSVVADEVAEAGRWVIGNIDDDGYLRSTLEELTRQSGLPLEAVEKALSVVQTFDPTGVGARDLRECLLLQMAAQRMHEPLAHQIVDQYMPLLKKRDLRGLSRVIGVPIEEIAAAAKVIGRLEPCPGRAFGGEDPVYITPDIYVYKIGDDYHVVLNEDGLPKLRINNMYRDVLSRRSDVAKDTKEYVRDKVRSAVWLIKSIHQRQRTIHKVMRSIIDFQREFFERGVAFLKPLNLRDVADDIGMHESTVSRVTTNKYVHTPQGILEMKYFFNSSIGRFHGESVASQTVKARINKIIGNEDSRRPLSDQRIAEMLKASNIDIARRTVTKYREAMNILSSTKRREVG